MLALLQRLDGLVEQEVKIYQLKIAIEVPDTFDVTQENSVNNWVNKAILNADGLCKYTKENGCSINHWAEGHVITEAEFDAQFERD